MRKKKEAKKDFSWKKLFKKLFLGILFLSFLGICFWTLFFSEYTKITNIKITSKSLEEEDLKDISNKLKDQKIIQFIPRDNFFLFPRKKFSDLVEDKFKIVREVDFKNIFPHEIEVRIKEREGMIIFCSREKCFLLDEKGEFFYELQGNEKEERFRDLDIVVDNSFPEVSLNQIIEDNRLILFVKEIKKQLKEKLGIEIERNIETPSLVSSEIRIRTKEGWKLYLSFEGEISDQISLLKEVLQSTIADEERDKLNYIDLRVKGKAIYNTSSGKNQNNELKEEAKDD